MEECETGFFENFVVSDVVAGTHSTPRVARDMSSGTRGRGGTVEGAEAFLDALVSRESFDRLALEGVKARAELVNALLPATNFARRARAESDRR